jgi:hypothetical protein
VNIDNAPVVALDDTIRSALFAVAGDLQIGMASVPAWTSAAGEVGVRESDLQRAVCRALQTQLGSVAIVEGPLPTGVKEHWSGRLGRIDVVARPAGSTEVCFETKLCGVDKLYEVIWDLLKLALLTALPEATAGYLVYAAPEAGWTPKEDRPIEIFEGDVFDVTELLRDHYPNPWRLCLGGTTTTRPIRLPAQVRTERIGSATIAASGGDWEVHCARVHGDATKGWIDFGSDGWPQVGGRPSPGRA